MLTSWKIKSQAFPMIQAEKDALFKCLENCQSIVHQLREIDWRSVDYQWSRAFECHNDFQDEFPVLGAFDFCTGTVYLAKTMSITRIKYQTPQEQLDIHMPSIAAVAVHELIHYRQRQKMGRLLYSLAALPGIRQLILEPAAMKAEDACYDMITP